MAIHGPRLHQLRRQHWLCLAAGRDHGDVCGVRYEAVPHGGLEERAALRGTRGFPRAALEVQLEIADLGRFS